VVANALVANALAANGLAADALVADGLAANALASSLACPARSLSTSIRAASTLIVFSFAACLPASTVTTFSVAFFAISALVSSPVACLVVAVVLCSICSTFSLASHSWAALRRMIGDQPSVIKH
jgi:hypothetical protein